MPSREEGRRRTTTVTVGIAAASVVGTVAIAATAYAQTTAATHSDTGTTGSGTTDTPTTGTDPGGTDSGTGMGVTSGDSGTNNDNFDPGPHAVSGGS